MRSKYKLSAECMTILAYKADGIICQRQMSAMEQKAIESFL
jgi:hypothetical protein